MFVVVYIHAAKKYIVVPEEWCYDINQEKLKNHGCNANQKIRIFWSFHGIDGHGCPDSQYPANFELGLADEYPPENDAMEACYVVNTVHYYSKYKNTIICVNEKNKFLCKLKLVLKLDCKSLYK